MISANSETEQAATITLTETELEGIYGGWSSDYSSNCYGSRSESIDINIDIDINISSDNYGSYNNGCERPRRRCGW